MGLEFHFDRSNDDEADETRDPFGLRAFLFETLRELSDVAEAQIVGVNGHAQVRVRFPDDDVRRLSESIRENLPAERMNDFFKEIEAHARDVRTKLKHMHGVDKNILAVSLHLNKTVRALFVAAASGDDPVVAQDEFVADEYDQAIEDTVDEFREADEWGAWNETHPEDAIVAEEAEEGEEESWKDSIDHWRPDDENEDDDEDDVGGGAFLKTPDPEDIDPETEALILAEAAEIPVDMDMVIASYQELQCHLHAIENASRAPELREEYHKVILAVMQYISKAYGGKVNLEVLAFDLQGDEVRKLMEPLNEAERLGCIDSVFHNVAESALMLVEAYSDIVNACSVGDDEENEAGMNLTLTFIQKLRERLGLA